MYAMTAIPIIMKMAGNICDQIWGTCAPQPKSTNINKSAIIPTMVAITEIIIDLIFLEFIILFSVLAIFAFKFD